MARPLRLKESTPAKASRRGPRAWLPLFVALLVIGGLPAATSGTGSSSNGTYSHTLPGPLLGIAGSETGEHLAVMDDSGRYTFLLDGGERERSWTAPTKGALGLAGTGVLEAPPQPVAVSMTPDGEHWAAATAYEENYGGQVDGFAQWSDEPIWTYQMADGDMNQESVQPTALASGGGYHAVGTSEGNVHLLAAEGSGGSDKKADRTYKQSNTGAPFGSIRSVAISQDGGLFLIGTETTGEPALHLYTDIFFKATFTRVTSSVETVAIAADGSRGAAVTGTGENTRVHFVDTQKGTTVWEHTIGSTATGLTLSDNGSLLAVGTEGGRVHLFEERGQARDSEPRETFTFDSGVTGVKASSQPGAVVVGTANGWVHLLDLQRSKPLWSFEAPGDAATVTVSGDTDLIAAATRTDDEGAVTYLKAEYNLKHRVPSTPRLAPGQQQSIPVELSNGGNRMERITVQWTDLPGHWEGHEGEILLAPNENGTLEAGLTLPPGQPEGDFRLGFTINSGSLRIPVELTARVPQVTSGQAVEVWAFEKAVPGGAPAAFLMQLTNTGNTNNEIALGYSGLPAGWEAEFTGPTETKLRPGEDRQTVLTLQAPPEAIVGDVIWVDLVIAWQHGEERHPLRIEVVEQDTYIFGLSDVIDNSSLPDDDRVGPLLERLTQAAEQGAAPQSDAGASSVLIPMGGLLLPVGALGAALLLTLVGVGRRGSKQEDPRTGTRRSALQTGGPLGFHDREQEDEQAGDPPHRRREHRHHRLQDRLRVPRDRHSRDELPGEHREDESRHHGDDHQEDPDHAALARPEISGEHTREQREEREGEQKDAHKNRAECAHQDPFDPGLEPGPGERFRVHNAIDRPNLVHDHMAQRIEIRGLQFRDQVILPEQRVQFHDLGDLEQLVVDIVFPRGRCTDQNESNGHEVPQ